MSPANRRILFFCTTSSPIGGVETWLDRACRYLAKRGFDPVVALVRGQQANCPERFRGFHPDLEMVEVDGRGFDREGRIRAAMRCIRRLRPGAVLPMSVVDANDAVLRCKLQGDAVRLVIHAQGNLPPMLADLRDLREGIDHAACPGRLTQSLLVEWAGFEKTRVTHIPHGADLPVCERSAADEAFLRIGYIGRLNQSDKRVLDLVGIHQALTRRQTPFTLTVAGDGPCGGELRDRLGRQENVRFLGAITHSKVYSDVLPHLDVLLLLSESEAFGIALAEAMRHGVVPVTSRYVGFHSERLVVDGRHGLSFEVGAVEEAAAQIARLASDRDLLQRLSACAVAHASSRYAWERSLAEWERLFDEVLARNPKVPPRSILPTSAPSGRLDRIGVPSLLVDWIRRGRRSLLGPAVLPGGEEWPLYRRTHTPQVLQDVAAKCSAIEARNAIPKQDACNGDLIDMAVAPC